MSRGFQWKGRTVSTYGEILDAAQACETPQEAKAFLDAYRAVNEHAEANIGYLIGYCDGPTRRFLHEMFAVDHPVFGSGY